MMSDTGKPASPSKATRRVPIRQRVAEVSVDAGLLPKTRTPMKSAASTEAKANVKVFAPVSAAATSLKNRAQQQALVSAGRKIEAAVEAGSLSATDAKKLVLSRYIRQGGARDTADTWYRTSHIAGLGGRTPAQLVRAGELKSLLEHISGKTGG